MSEVITSDNVGSAVIKRYEQLETARGVWKQHWDEVAKFNIPKKDNVFGQAVRGEKRANRLFDTEAILACNDLAAALRNRLTNPSLPWFNLGTGNKEVDSDKEVQRWLFNTSTKMHQTMNSSNFQTEIHEAYRDLASIGTASLRTEEDDLETVRYFSEPIYDVVFTVDPRGRVNMVSREYEYTFKQIAEEFGLDKVEDSLRKQEESGKKFKIIQEVSRRDDIERQGKIGQEAMPFRSIHVMKSTGKVLRDSGFQEFPYAIPRWTLMNKEVHGRSPAMMALADTKMANAMQKVNIQAAQLQMAPPLQVPDNGFLTPLEIKPFGTNYYRANSQNRIEPLFTGANVQLGVELVEFVHSSIRRHFLLDKLTTPEIDRATATEVLQRRDEKLRFLGPTLGRLDRELLKPIVDRTFGIMERKGMFDAPPEKLVNFVKEQGGEFDLAIKYRSTIAQAQLISQSENIVRAINATSIVVGAQPEIMDNIDGDKLLKKNFEIYGVDPDITRDDSEIKGIRENRQAALQAQAEQEGAQREAETINKLGDTDAKLQEASR